MRELTKKLILYLVRKLLGVDVCEPFQFTNQKSDAVYYFANGALMKAWHRGIEKSHVSLNWLLDDDLKIKKFYDD